MIERRNSLKGRESLPLRQAEWRHGMGGPTGPSIGGGSNHAHRIKIKEEGREEGASPSHLVSSTLKIGEPALLDKMAEGWYSRGRHLEHASMIKWTISLLTLNGEVYIDRFDWKTPQESVEYERQNI